MMGPNVVGGQINTIRLKINFLIPLVLYISCITKSASLAKEEIIIHEDFFPSKQVSRKVKKVQRQNSEVTSHMQAV